MLGPFLPVSSLCLVVVVVGLLVHSMIQKWKYNYPPGPRALPLIGNLLQINRSKIHEQAFEWSKIHGPVITLKLGTVPVIFVNHIDAALEVLVEKSTEFASRMSSPSRSMFSYGGKDITTSAYGPSWNLHKRITSKALRYQIQGDALDKRISGAVKEAFEEIDKRSGEFEPLEYIHFILMNIFSGICFGDKYTFNEDVYVNLLKKNDELVHLMGTGTWEDYIPVIKHVNKTKALNRIEQLTNDLIEGFLRKKFNDAKHSFRRDNVRHVSDRLIHTQVEAKEEGRQELLESLTDDHMIQILSDIFYAAVEAITTALNWAINHMIAFNDVQDKVQDEIDRVVDKGRLPKSTDRQDLSYTAAVLHESMRLASQFPTGTTHVTTCDTEVAGYKIPKGTAVAINHWALHNDPKAWEDSNKFIPERFLDDTGKLGPTPKNWLPFSSGKRGCLGEFVAKPILLLLFACLMQNYKWKMLPGKCADLTPAGTSFALICKPYKVVVDRRI